MDRGTPGLHGLLLWWEVPLLLAPLHEHLQPRRGADEDSLVRPFRLRAPALLRSHKVEPSHPHLQGRHQDSSGQVQEHGGGGVWLSMSSLRSEEHSSKALETLKLFSRKLFFEIDFIGANSDRHWKFDKLIIQLKCRKTK